MNRRHAHVAHLDEVEPVRVEHGRTEVIRRQLGRAAGARQLGCSHIELPPGKRSWPRHWHAANEEAIFVLEGVGRLRLGDETIEVRAGDYVALPAGPQAAHEMRNESEAPLRYLCFSTMIPTDICGYPDSGKVALFSGGAPGASKSERTLDVVLRREPVDYWEGED